ncbi:MAG: hypothetical protein EBE86_023725 [Hormoscilla sp. GUM202]|nr:hypothetical protein [Hormoscilla sp. GUM202]
MIPKLSAYGTDPAFTVFQFIPEQIAPAKIHYYIAKTIAQIHANGGKLCVIKAIGLSAR